MAFTLTGTRYIGSGALPTPVAGYDVVAVDTGNFYVSNSSATAWVLIGNVNSTNLGMLPLTGGTLTGAIAGATGLAPNDSPDFTTTAKLGGVQLATVTDLSNTQTTVLNTIAPKVSEAIASVTSGITTAANIAMASGLLTFTSAVAQTIPLPVFSDGSTAPEASCKWMVALVGTGPTYGTLEDGWPCGRSDGNGDTGIVLSANPSTTRTFYGILKDVGGTIYKATFSYLIIGTR